MTEIPDSVKSRILKMMALANDERGNEHVAAIASAKIQALLAEYNLELSQITGSDDENPDAVREKVADAVQTNAD